MATYNTPPAPAPTPAPVPSTANFSQAFTGFGNLIRLLPTGTLFFYQFMNPITTNNGNCTTSNKYVSSVLFAVCSLLCFFSTFTDSYLDKHGVPHYGIATFKGFWPSSSASAVDSTVDFRAYRLNIGDYLHAALSLTVFCVLSLLDSNTVRCFYPNFENTEKALMMALPAVIGSAAATIFSTFPMVRHGVGYGSRSTPTPMPAPSSNSAVAPVASGMQTPYADQKV